MSGVGGDPVAEHQSGERAARAGDAGGECEAARQRAAHVVQLVLDVARRDLVVVTLAESVAPRAEDPYRRAAYRRAAGPRPAQGVVSPARVREPGRGGLRRLGPDGVRSPAAALAVERRDRVVVGLAGTGGGVREVAPGLLRREDLVRALLSRRPPHLVVGGARGRLPGHRDRSVAWEGVHEVDVCGRRFGTPGTVAQLQHQAGLRRHLHLAAAHRKFLPAHQVQDRRTGRALRTGPACGRGNLHLVRPLVPVRLAGRVEDEEDSGRSGRSAGPGSPNRRGLPRSSRDGPCRRPVGR